MYTRIILAILFTRVFCKGDIIKENAGKHACIIGAGVSGLSVTRRLQLAGAVSGLSGTTEGIRVTVFEATDEVGGTWRYQPETGRDKDGLPIYGSMYKNLRTNLPIITMEFPDSPFATYSTSYPTQACFYDYIVQYAHHRNLLQYIKFHHLVTSVKRSESKWIVQYKHVLNGTTGEENCDFMIVCNGHNHEPNWPANIEDVKRNFTGRIVHSHDYREPEMFRGRRVLVVGAGPSGWDIGLEVAEVASKLLHSHHSRANSTTPFPAHYVRKYDVKGVVNSTVLFEDDTEEDVDDIIYCTGYQYYYPFLDESAGLHMKLHYLTHLYKNLVNIKQPTMMFLGLGVHGSVLSAIHIQARYVAALVYGNFSLPTEDQMMSNWQLQVDGIRLLRNKPLTALHDLGPNETAYYNSLADEAKIQRLLPIIGKAYQETSADKTKNWYEFRYYRYTVLDPETFTKGLDKDNMRCVFQHLC